MGRLKRQRRRMCFTCARAGGRASGRKVGAAAAVAAAAEEEDTWKQTNGRRNDRTSDERAIGQKTATVRPPHVRPSFPFSAGKLLTPWTADAAAAPAAYTWPASPNLMFFHLYYLHF